MSVDHSPSPSPWPCRLSVVIPAYNEENGIVPTLQGLREALPEAEIIVVDDGSRDRTAERANSVPGVTVLRQPFNRGYGAALKAGMRAARRDYVAWFDADNEHKVENLIAMAKRLDSERLVAVIGQRPSGTSRFRTVGKAVIRALAWSLGLAAGTDLNCGLRVFRREVILPYLSLLPNRYSASMTSTMIMIQRDYPVAFEPVTTRPRIGTSKVVLGDGLQALILVMRMIMLFAPLRVFLPVGALLSGVGLVYGLVLALAHGLGFPSLSVVMVLAGLILVLQGFIADQISYMRLSQLESPARDESELPPPDEAPGQQGKGKGRQKAPRQVGDVHGEVLVEIDQPGT